MQTQRLIGQQSLGEFMSLHVDLEKVFQDNIKKKGVKRKNNCIINEGDNPTKDERKKKVEENRIRYGLDPEVVKSIKLPRPHAGVQREIYSLEEIESDKFSTLEKVIHLESLKKAIEKRLVQENQEEDLPKVVITVHKIDDDTWEHWDNRSTPKGKGRKKK